MSAKRGNSGGGRETRQYREETRHGRRGNTYKRRDAGTRKGNIEQVEEKGNNIKERVQKGQAKKK